jgi:methyl-accepting chemotaxis protein
MMALDFSMAKLAHQQWKFRVRSYLDGLEQMSTSEVVSHKDCEFGKWLYAKGMAEMGHLPEMGRLERSHADLHDSIRKAVDAKQAGNEDAAESHYQDVVRLSGEVVQLIDQIMAKL